MPSTPPPVHTPLSLFHPSTSPVFSLVSSSQYVMGCPHPLPLPPHLRPFPTLSPCWCPRLPAALYLFTLTHTPATCRHPGANVTSPCLYPNFSSGFCSTPQCPTASRTQHSQHCPSLFPDCSLQGALSGSITFQPPNHPSQNPRAPFTSSLFTPSPISHCCVSSQIHFPFPSFKPHFSRQDFSKSFLAGL